MDVWPLVLVGYIETPLGSAKKPGVVCQKIPDLDINLASHIGPKATLRQHHRFEVPEGHTRDPDA